MARIAAITLLLATLPGRQMTAHAEQAGLEALLAQVEDSVIASEYRLFGVKNGEYYITRFDTRTFDIMKDLGELRRKYRQSIDGCNVAVKGSSDASLLREIGSQTESSPDGIAMLRMLEETGQVLAVSGFQWDGKPDKSGNDGFCNRSSFRIYFKTGKVLNLNYTFVSFAGDM